MQKYGLLANAEQSAVESPACLICDDPKPVYAWTDYSGEGYCLRCGAPYQLKWGELKEGESYPRLNLRDEAIPMLRRHFAETGKPAGLGTFIWMGDYPEVLRARKAFNAWFEQHQDEYPELCRSQSVDAKHEVEVAEQ